VRTLLKGVAVIHPYLQEVEQQNKAFAIHAPSHDSLITMDYGGLPTQYLGATPDVDESNLIDMDVDNTQVDLHTSTPNSTLNPPFFKMYIFDVDLPIDGRSFHTTRLIAIYIVG
jgi:hypothetical protein